MPFRYQLQKVLNLMENREKAIDAELLGATALRNVELAKLNEIETRKTAAQKGLNAQMASGATPDVAASNDYIQLLDLRRESQSKALAAANKVVDDVTKRQTEARKERQKLEKHKTMKLEEWKIEDKKREAKRTDEMAGTIFMKNRAKAEENAIEELDRLDKMEKLKLLRQMREKRESKW